MLVLPKRNDSMIVAATSRSYYRDLIAAGVKLFEYRRGLAPRQDDGGRRKTGHDRIRQPRPAQLRTQFRKQHPVRGREFRARSSRAAASNIIADCDEVQSADVERFSLGARLWQNSLAMLSPIL